MREASSGIRPTAPLPLRKAILTNLNEIVVLSRAEANSREVTMKCILDPSYSRAVFFRQHY